MTEVRLSRRALLDIDEIDLYSVETWGETVAAKYLEDLHDGAARLGENPRLLQERPETSLRLRFYRVREHVLVCDFIGDCIVTVLPPTSAARATDPDDRPHVQAIHAAP